MSSLELRLHGRGGQGVVTAAEVLALAGFLAGLETQAFPSFGSERMGAPVAAFCRLSDRPIHVREPVMRPDVVVVLDASLLHHVDVGGGLARDGLVLINSARTPEELQVTRLGFPVPPSHVLTVPATDPISSNRRLTPMRRHSSPDTGWPLTVAPKSPRTACEAQLA